MSEHDLQESHFTFRSDSLDGEHLHVLRIVGEEGLSQPFSFQIDLVSSRSDLDLQAPVGHPATVTLHGYLTRPVHRPYQRKISGVVDCFEFVRSTKRHSIYRATLVPSIYPLAYTRDSQIFQGLTTIEIVQRVLSAAGISDRQVQLMVHGSYLPRDFCVQHQESDLHFISRLLEHHGIFYYFSHGESGDVLVIADGAHAFSPLPHHSDLLHADVLSTQEEAITELRAAFSIRPGRVTMRDFRFKQPKLDLEVSRRHHAFGNLEIYESTGRYVDPKMGEHLAKIRLEEQRCDAMRYIAESNCVALMPGYTFACTNHQRKGFNDEEFLIVRLEMEAHQPEALREDFVAHHGSAPARFKSRVTCIPKAIPYRPKRTTPRPSVHGVQTAIVVGPPGEEIHCDEHGRVRVQFHWDRDGKSNDSSSCWIRVSQPWGGLGQGGMFIPRVGQEVIIQHLDGDPDRPVIVGRVYNGENPVPHGLPAGKNISTIRSSSTPGGGGFNELRFDDSAGGEQVFFHAQKALDIVVGGNKTEDVTGTVTETYHSTQSTTVTGDVNETYQANQTTTVTGDVKETYSATQTTEVTGAVTQTYHSTQDATITGAFTETINGGSTQTISSSATQVIYGGLTQVISGGSSQTISGETSEAVVGKYSQNVVGPYLQTVTGSYSQTVTGSASNHIAGNLQWNIDGGAQIITPKWDVVAPDWFTTGAMNGSAYGFSLSLCALAIQATALSLGDTVGSFQMTGIEGYQTGISIGATGISAAASGIDLTLSGVSIEIVGQKIIP